jgi:hypothetical protein
VSASRRFHLLLPVELEAEAKAFGRASGLALAPAVRLLVARGLEAEADSAGPRLAESPVLLATLAAAEHAVLMVASILPEGEQRMRALAARASQAAEERLAMVVEPAAPGEGIR